MKTPFGFVAPALAAAVIGSVVALAPIAGATTPSTPAAASVTISAMGGADPLVPYGTDPQLPPRQGYVDSNHDEINTTNGLVDLPF